MFPGIPRLHAPRVPQAWLLLVVVLVFVSLLLLTSNSAADTVVTMVGFTFEPRDVTITAGETVTWTNPEAMFHTVTSGPGSIDPEAGFTFDEYFLGDLKQRFAYAFADSGTFPYFCRFHEGLKMVGTVTVLPAQDTGVPGAGASVLDLTVQPNPTRGATTLSFALRTEGAVRVAVYDLSGRLVQEVFRGRLPEGRQAVTWDGNNGSGAQAASGAYVLRLETKNGALTSRVMLLH